jgi:hypothetical protein
MIQLKPGKSFFVLDFEGGSWFPDSKNWQDGPPPENSLGRDASVTNQE